MCSNTNVCFRSGPATTLRRQTPPTPKTLSPLKVGAGLRFTQKVFLMAPQGLLGCITVSLPQKSPSTWTSRTPSPPPAVRMGSRSASSPPLTPAAESRSTNRHFTRRRRRLKATKCAGSVPRRGRSAVTRCFFPRLKPVSGPQVHADRGRLPPPEEGPADAPPPASGPLRPEDSHHHGM